MKSNIGNLDRTARIGMGAPLIGLAFAEVIGAWGYIGVVPLVTGLFGTCPAYSLLGMSSCPVRNR
jgi:hypothetical protein